MWEKLTFHRVLRTERFERRQVMHFAHVRVADGKVGTVDLNVEGRGCTTRVENVPIARVNLRKLKRSDRWSVHYYRNMGRG